MSAGPSSVHRCTVHGRTGRRLTHVVLPPPRPMATPLRDLRDAGHEVVAYGVDPEEIAECKEAARYPWSEHVLLREADR